MATADNNLNAQERLQQNTQRHKRYLHCTGGALAAHTCFWVVVRYAWEDRKAIMEQYNKDEDNKIFAITVG